MDSLLKLIFVIAALVLGFTVTFLDPIGDHEELTAISGEIENLVELITGNPFPPE